MDEIVTMLEACAKGAKIEAKTHRNWVYYDGRIFRGLPLGEHGRRKNPEIKVMHVRHLINFFRLNKDCAKGVIPALG